MGLERQIYGVREAKAALLNRTAPRFGEGGFRGER